MSIYNHVVVAIDPFIDCSQILSKAIKMKTSNGHIHLIHVMDVVMIFPSAPLAPASTDLPGMHTESKEAAHKSMLDMVKRYDLNKENIHLKIGSTAKEIRKFATEINADLIVIGSHGRHGLGLLLGSTASSVIHGSPCDMLVVKIET